MAEDPPEPIVNGAIDLGALAAEFLMLGLDPYPRKPGAVFEPVDCAGRSGRPSVRGAGGAEERRFAGQAGQI